jgi:hypothetical protein
MKLPIIIINNISFASFQQSFSRPSPMQRQEEIKELRSAIYQERHSKWSAKQSQQANEIICRGSQGTPISIV